MAASAPTSTDTTPQATVVFVGHHQSGKSTAAAHILVKLGGVDKRALERVERETSNRPTSRYAWILDRWRQERERSTTLDLKLCRVAIPGPSASPSPSSASPSPSSPSPSSPASPGLMLTLVDTPGHPDYLKNTIAGITQADVAVLVVDGRPAVLDSPSACSQTRELAQLATNLANQRSLVVAINFLDVAMEADPALGEQRFREAVEAVRRLIKRQAQSSVFVPVSAYSGDNLTERSPRLPWWEGPTLTGAIAAAVAAATPAAAPGAVTALPLRIPLIGVYKVGGIGTVPAGRLAGGAIHPGAHALLLPPPAPPPASDAAGTSTSPSETATAAAGGEAEAAAAMGGGGGGGGPLAAVVRSIESFHDGRGAAAVGEWVGMCVKGVHVSRLRRGCVMSDPGDRPARLAESFTAKVQVLRVTSKREGCSRSLRPGYVAVVHVHTAQAPCRLMSIRKCNNKGELVEAAASSLREGDIAQVELRPLVPLVVEPFRDFPALGRFAVRAAVRAATDHVANPLAQMGGGGGGPMGQAGGMTPVIVALGRVEAVKYVGGTAAEPPTTFSAAVRPAKAAERAVAKLCPTHPQQQPEQPPQSRQEQKQESQKQQEQQPSPNPAAATSSVSVHVEAAPASAPSAAEASAAPVASVPFIDISSSGRPSYTIDYAFLDWLRRDEEAAGAGGVP